MIPTMIYGTAWKKQQTAALVEKALEVGFRAIDTANQPKHYHEPGVGEAVRAYLKTRPRESLFLQTKFTSVDGQDERVPYNPKAPLIDQVEQSLKSSLEHLGVDYLDSLLIHGPCGHPGLVEEDVEVWRVLESFVASGRVRSIGISNVNYLQLEELLGIARVKPTWVQNRCFAMRGWDDTVRKICREAGILYQGFSLLTANPEVVMNTGVRQVAGKRGCTAPEVVFAYARSLGILPLTGTTDETHMRQDLTPLLLSEEEIQTLGCL